MNKERIKEFINNSLLEIYITEGKVMNIGLKWGYSKDLTIKGFPRAEQIKILDYLTTLNQLELKELGVLIWTRKNYMRSIWKNALF